VPVRQTPVKTAPIVKEEASYDSSGSDDDKIFCFGLNYTGANIRIKGVELKYQISGDTKVTALRIYSGQTLYSGFELGTSDSRFAAGVEGGAFFGVQKKFGSLALYFDGGLYYVSVWQKNFVNNGFSDYGLIFNTGLNVYLF